MYTAMEFEWDEAKAEANLRKHGITFEFATLVFNDPDRTERLDLRDYEGEERWVTIGRSAEFVLSVVYTLREESIRLISARRATRHEFLDYWNR